MARSVRNVLLLCSGFLIVLNNGLGQATSGDPRIPTGSMGPWPRPQLSQSSPLVQTVMGYVWDQSASAFRKVQGIPGASFARDLYFTGWSLISGRVSPDQTSALMIDSSGTVYHATLPPDNYPTALNSGVPLDTQIAFSPSGNYAVLFGPDVSQTILISGLPNQPAVGNVAALSSITGITAAAVSDSGLVLAAAPISGSSSQIYSASASSSQPVMVTQVSQAGGLSFVRGTSSALATDTAAGTALLLSNLSGSASVQTLATGLAQPAYVSASYDGRWAWVVSGSSTVVQISLAQPASSPATYSCSCQITALDPLQGHSVFRLTAVESGQLLVFDGDFSSPRVVPVPLISTVSTAGAQ
ncbi:MAG TPA: hypothetical protein VHZ07_20685 [Bryobacteraceae bacterium]|jgi:hypothetical protein|nr:hypothetical protein [Bryobacteraceae bacterium]